MKSLTEIKNNIIPREKHKFGISYHCFVPLTMNNEKVINHFILFCHNTGLLIKYDEQNKSFHYQKLPICPAFNDFASYSFVYLHDFIFLFGGINSITHERTKLVYKYSMKDKIWDECKITLPMEINLSFAILSDDKNVHVIGGSNVKDEVQTIHLSVNVKELFINIYEKIIELKNEIMKMKLERPYIIPIEKQRMNEDEKENKEVIELPEDWKTRKTQIETFEKKLKEWNEEKRMESNGMNWDDIWGFDGELQQTKKR
ncbi:hypothetical protein RFI_37748, partial [Reticulomyxa filosa]